MARKPDKAPQKSDGDSLRLLVPAALLFLSGAAALIYQILWSKQLALIVGVDVHAVTTAVGAFFAGLALGSWLFGRRADAIAQPLRLYALLELAVGVAGVGATFALAHAAPLFATLEKSAGVLAWLLPFVLVGTPAALMGGTVPVLVRALVPAAGQLGAIGGRLYAANTVGAIAGTLLAPFVLIPAFGVRGAAVVAGALNVAAAAGAFLLVRRPRPSSSGIRFSSNPDLSRTTDEDEGRGGVDAARKSRRLALGLYAVAGGIAIGYEVVWSQVIVQWTSTRTFAFAVVLAVYLTGLALGSAWSARRAARARDPWGDFGLLIASAGLVALLALAFSGSWLPPLQVKAATVAFKLTHQESFAMAARFLVPALWIVFVPTFLLGAAFPVALRLADGAANPGRDTGAILALNTAGGIVGTLLTGFVLVPQLGLERSLAWLAVGAAAIGVAAVLRGRAVRPALRATVLGGAVVTLVAAALIPPNHLAELLAHARGGTITFHEVSAGGTVAIIEQGREGSRFSRLYIQGVSNSGDSMTSLRYMRLQALLPLIIHRGEPKSALVIGLGTGITAGSLLSYPGLERRVVAELLPAVVRGTAQFSGNQGVASDSRMDLRVRDGRRELLRSAETYDLITLEPPPPSAAGVVNLYSRDFYELAATRLNPDGLVAQWLPLPTQTDEDTRSLVRSFLDVFPYATLWTTELHEMLLVGSLSPIELEVALITARFNQPTVTRALAEVGVASPAALLATWVTDQAGLERYAGTALPTTDDRPRIEYGRWVLPNDFWQTLPHLLDQQSDPPLVGDSDSLKAEMNHERTILNTFYDAGLRAYRRDHVGWRQAMTLVLRADPQNPYYRWFANADAAAP